MHISTRTFRISTLHFPNFYPHFPHFDTILSIFLHRTFHIYWSLWVAKVTDIHKTSLIDEEFPITRRSEKRFTYGEMVNYFSSVFFKYVLWNLGKIWYNKSEHNTVQHLWGSLHLIVTVKPQDILYVNNALVKSSSPVLLLILTSRTPLFFFAWNIFSFRVNITVNSRQKWRKNSRWYISSY
jgi:hypothetical protein